MTVSYRKVQKFVKQLYEQYFRNNRIRTVESFNKRFQNKLIAVRKLYNIKDMPVIQAANITTLQSSTAMPQRLINWWQWYAQLTGLNNVEISKQQVISIQEKLYKCQEERRQFHGEAIKIRDRLKEIYAELIQTKRDDPKYVQLTIMENKNLQEHNSINRHIELLENTERDYFMQLTISIKEYHDNQTMNAQKYKYLSIIASALTFIVSLIVSMIYNNKRINGMKNALDSKHDKIRGEMKNIINSLHNDVVRNLSELSRKINISPANEKKDPQSQLNYYILGSIISSSIIFSCILSRILFN